MANLNGNVCDNTQDTVEEKQHCDIEKECHSFQEALRRYLDKNDMTQARLAKVLNVSENTVKNWMRKDRREPGLSIIYEMADRLNLTYDELLRGISTNNLDAHRRTGLSTKAIDSLAYFHHARNKAEPTVHTHLLPLLDMLLTDKLFLEELEAKVWRLVHLKAEQNAYAYEDETEINDLTDSIEYKLSSMFVEQIRKYVDSVVPSESDAIRQKDLEEMAEEVRRSQKK